MCGLQLSSDNTLSSWSAEGALPWARPACPQQQEERPALLCHPNSPFLPPV